MRNKIFNKFFLFLIIFIMVFSDAPFYALTGFISSYEKTSGIVDKIWQLEQNHNSDVVDNFASIRDVAEKLRIHNAMAAVNNDVASESHVGTTGNTSAASFTWTHTPVGTPRGVLVYVYTISATKTVTGVTYGGVAMTEVAGGAAVDTANEPGRIDTFFLGSGIPTGAKAIVVSRTNNATIMYASAVTQTAATDTEIYLPGIVLLQNNGTFAVQSVDDGGTGVNSIRYAAGYSGGASVLVAGTGSTVLNSIDFGAYTVTTARETTAGQGARNVGFAYATSDDRAAVHLAIREIPVSNTTTISNFVTAEPGDSIIAPGTSDLVDSFGLATNSGVDTVTGVTVGLAAGMGARISTVAITNDGDTVTYCSVAPSGDTATLAGCGIPVSVTNTQFKIKTTAVAHATMPVPPGTTYPITGTVTGWTGTNTTHAGTDSGSSTVTIDNASPNGATAVSGTPGNTANTINWTSSNSADFNTTSGSVIYRWTSGSAGIEVPTEGSAPAIGSTNGTATVSCVVSSAVSTALSKIDGTGGSAECTNVALTNGQPYTYKAFQKDVNGNYDVGVLIGSFTPVVALSLTIAATAGSQITNLNSGDTSKFINNTTCNSEANCSAFKMTASGGAVTITSIKVTETGSVVANTDLSNPTLIYDTDANYSNGTTGTFGAVAAFAADQTATFSNAGLAIPSGNTYYFYIRIDMKSGTPTYPAGGQLIDFQIVSTADIITSGSPTKSGAPATLVGSTTVLPQIISYTNSTEAGLNYAASCTGCGARIGPASGYRQTLAISGYGFGADPGLGSRDTATNKVEIVGVATDVLVDDASANTNVSVWSNTSITIRTDSSITGNADADWGTNFGGASALKVTAGGQANPTNLNFYIFPQVTSLTVPTAVPNAAREYDSGDTDGVVTLNGTRFGTAQAGGWVRILGCDFTTCSGPAGTVAINSWSNTAIAVQVPTVIADNVYTGSLIMQQGSGSSNKTHTYTTTGLTILPRITSTAPTSGSFNDAVTVNGNHFCQNNAVCPGSFDVNNKVIFSSAETATTFTSWSNTAIVTAVPINSVTGNVTITSNAYISNGKNFTVLSPTPSDPSSLNQFKDSGLTQVLAIGGLSSTTPLYLTMSMLVGISGGTLYPQIEYKPNGTGFSCSGTGACGSAIEGAGKTGPGPIDCSQVANGCAISITPTDTTYHWQARVRHNKGGTDYYSNWVSFGANGEGATDFQIDTAAPVITFSGTGTCADASRLVMSNSATIDWYTTLESSSGQVEYSKNSDLSSSVSYPIPADPSAFSHSIALSNLDSNSTYYFKVTATDSAGNSTAKPLINPFCSFTTANVPGPAKTTKFYVTGMPSMVSGGTTATSSFSVYVPELGYSLKSAFIELSGVSTAVGINNIGVQINSQALKTYVINSNESAFKILYKIDSANLNLDPIANIISISPSLNTNIASARIYVTYSFTP